MKKEIIANFKMNQTQSETKSYLLQLLPKVDNQKFNLSLCFPYTSLSMAAFFLKDGFVKLGAQTVSDEELGGCTGEISAKMLKDLGVSQVIVGHSERRSKFKENNKMINRKIKAALKNGLEVVLCVGESLAEKNTLKTYETIRIQVEEALKGLYENELDNVIIAYEPIWAVGTGKNATVKEIEYGVKAIRKVIGENFSEKAAENIEVLYGGSINTKNINPIYASKAINGILVGASCLDPDNFAYLLSLV